jgi:hypothetical protein
LPLEGLLLGNNEFRGVKKPVRLSREDRRKHTYFIGQTGTGKSTLLENLALQDMYEGRGFAFVDPHGDSAENLLAMVPESRYDDVIYFNPADTENPVGLNIFEDVTDKDRIINECIDMLYALYDPGHTGIFGPIGEHMFRNAALLLMSDPQGGTWIDIPHVFRDPEFVKSKLKYVTDKDVFDYWTREFPASQRSQDAGATATWFISKWGPFVSNAVMRNTMGQVKSSFNWREIMDGSKIFIVNLSKGLLGEKNAYLLGMFFVMKFQTAAMSRADIQNENDRVDFCLYVDEFQNFATDSFESILSEARKYRLNLIVANQYMSQLSDKIREAILGNIGTIICGRIGVTDAELVIKKMGSVFDLTDLQYLPNLKAAVTMLIEGVPSAPFSMSILPRMGKANEQVREYLKQKSSMKYGRPRAEIEGEIAARNGSIKSAVAPPSATPGGMPPRPARGSFLDEWLAKRQNINSAPKTAPTASSAPTEPQNTPSPPAETPK